MILKFFMLVWHRLAQYFGIALCSALLLHVVCSGAGRVSRKVQVCATVAVWFWKVPCSQGEPDWEVNSNCELVEDIMFFCYLGTQQLPWFEVVYPMTDGSSALGAVFPFMEVFSSEIITGWYFRNCWKGVGAMVRPTQTHHVVTQTSFPQETKQSRSRIARGCVFPATFPFHVFLPGFAEKSSSPFII